MSQKRNTHTERVLKNLSKKASGAGINTNKLNSLKEQYDVIKDDFIKLRKDIEKGYDMAKSSVEKKSLLGNLFRSH